MPRELIAPGINQVAFREYQNEPIAAGQIRVRSLYATAKHGTEMALYKGYGSQHGAYDRDYQLFRSENPAFRYPAFLGKPRSVSTRPTSP